MGTAAEDLLQALDRTLTGDQAAARDLVRALRPVIQARVARVLMRYRAPSRGRPLTQELDDLVQHVLLQLFTDRAKELRAFDPAMGLSFSGYVGLIAERDALSVLRSRRASPFTEEPTEREDLADMMNDAPGHEIEIEDADLLAHVVARLREELSDKGSAIFELLIVEDQSVEHVCAVMRMTADAVYAWRSRILKRARVIAAEISSDPDAPRRIKKGRPAHA